MSMRNTRTEQRRRGYPAAHIQQAAVEGDLQPPHPAEAALDAVGGRGQQVEQGDQPQKAHPQGDDLRLVGEQAHDGLGAEKADRHDGKAVHRLDPHPGEEALPHPLGLAGAAVLGHQGGHGVADVLLRGVGKVVHPAGGRKGGHRVDPHGVDHRLDGDLAQLDGALLHGGGPAVLDGLPQHGRLATFCPGRAPAPGL